MADAVARTWWEVDAAKDESPLDARRRAAQYLTAEFAQLNTQELPSSPGHWWNVLAHDKARYKVTVTSADEAVGVDEQAHDTATMTSRARLVELIPVNNEGRTGDTRVVLMTLDLYRPSSADAWLVDDMTMDEAADLSKSPQDFG
ncbi:hypothetical protein [Isoptericola sp. NPDC056605]|uniref:hypothetical protein n=1 Tax=Isoptericola sp. NPDC056605 TaxID=3345876 RepID=UPI003674DB08